MADHGGPRLILRRADDVGSRRAYILRFGWYELVPAAAVRRSLSTVTTTPTTSLSESRAMPKRLGPWSALALDATVARRVILLVAVVHFAIAWFSRIPGIAWGEDDAQYYNLARELAQFSYHERWDIGSPLHVRYPPLFPALLALVGVSSGWSVDAMLFVIALCSALAIVAFFDAARRMVGVEIALLASVLWAFNPLALRSGGWLLSETLFNLFFALSLWGISREEEGTRFGVLAGAGMIAASLTRTAGVALVIGLLGYWLMRRRWKRAALLTVLAGGTIGAWLVWSFVSPESENQRLYSSDLAKITAAAPPARRTAGESTQAGAIEAPLARVGARVERMATKVIPTVLAFRTKRGTIVDNVAWLAVLVATGAVGVVSLFRRWFGAALPFTTYLLLLTVWTWMLERYFSPIVPLLFLTMLLGASTLAQRLIPRWSSGAVLVLTALLLSGEVPQASNLVLERARCDRAHALTSEACYPEDERNYLMMAQWARDSTPPDAVFLASKDAAFFTHSGRRVVNQLRALREDSTTIIGFLRAHGVTHVAVGSVGVRMLRQGRLMAVVCRDLTLVREFNHAEAVLRVRGLDEPRDDGAACRVLAPWRERKPEQQAPARTAVLSPSSENDDSTSKN